VVPRAGLDTVVKRKIPIPCRDSNLDHPAHSPALYHIEGSGLFNDISTVMLHSSELYADSEGRIGTHVH
jgi:hypothetical protein